MKGTKLTNTGFPTAPHATSYSTAGGAGAGPGQCAVLASVPWCR